MDEEYVKELIAMYQEGEIDAADLMMDLDIGGFDGDLIEYL